MKCWFVFKVNGERVAVWTNSDADGIEKLKKVYGEDASVEFIGWGPFEEYDKRLTIGMSAVDTMIASGFLRTKEARILGLIG